MDASSAPPDASPSVSPPTAAADVAVPAPASATAVTAAAGTVGDLGGPQPQPPPQPPQQQPPHRTDEDRRAFFAASNARRKAREQAKHEARQAALQGAKTERAMRDAMEAVEWCRCNLTLEAGARALRDAGALSEQRSAVLLQFSGTKYKGMQIQNRSQVATIEGTLLHALYRAGAISDHPELTLQQLRWQRTARTDAGVHAAFNVVSCVLQVDDNESLAQRLNALLPSDMHVLAILPVADLSSYAASSAAAAASAAAAVTADAAAMDVSDADAAVAASSTASSSSAAAVSIAAPPHPSVAALDAHGFHAKESCTGRAYVYIMPSAVWGLCAPATAGTAAAAATTEQLSAATAAVSETTQAATASPAASASPPASSPAPAAASSARPPAAKASAGPASSSSSSSKPPSLPYAPLFSPAVAAAAATGAFALEYESFARARLDPAQVERINAVLARLQGEKLSFHNFAKVDVASVAKAIAAAKAAKEGAGGINMGVGLQAAVGAAAIPSASPSASASPFAFPSSSPSPSTSPSSSPSAPGGDASSPAADAAAAAAAPAAAPAEDYRRSVTRCAISELFERDGVEYCRVVVDGKSFMLHQIRKMMAMAVLAVREMVPPDIFDTVFDPSVWYDVPIAPARGLLLRRPFFAYYDAACEQTAQAHCSIGRAYERLQTDVAAFQSSVLEAEICNARASHSAYRMWIKSLLDQANLQFRRSALQQTQLQLQASS